MLTLTTTLTLTLTLNTATFVVVTTPGIIWGGHVFKVTCGTVGVETSSAPQNPSVGKTKQVYKKQSPFEGLYTTDSQPVKILQAFMHVANEVAACLFLGVDRLAGTLTPGHKTS
jgi:hypothetical protein